MSTAKAPAAPSDRICQKNSQISRSSKSRNAHIKRPRDNRIYRIIDLMLYIIHCTFACLRILQYAQVYNTIGS